MELAVARTRLRANLRKLQNKRRAEPPLPPPSPPPSPPASSPSDAYIGPYNDDEYDRIMSSLAGVLPPHSDMGTYTFAEQYFETRRARYAGETSMPPYTPLPLWFTHPISSVGPYTAGTSMNFQQEHMSPTIFSSTTDMYNGVFPPSECPVCFTSLAYCCFGKCEQCHQLVCESCLRTLCQQDPNPPCPLCRTVCKNYILYNPPSLKAAEA